MPRKPDEETTAPPMPVDFGPEVLAFMSRLMSGYEQAHRRVADLCDMLSAQNAAAQAATTQALELQLKLAAEREELLSRRVEREAIQTIAKRREEAISDVARDVRALLPAVGKRLLGVPLTGDDSHGLQDLLATLSNEQIEAVMSKGELKLSVAQRSLLASVLGSLAGEQPQPEAAE